MTATYQLIVLASRPTGPVTPWNFRLESAPEAFIGMLKGRNFGKQLVKLA
jgi:NADPH-dependent curcumin reductase CurA